MSFPYSVANPADYLPGTSISQVGAQSGALNARRVEPLISLRGGEVCRLTFAGGQAVDPLNVWSKVGNPGVQGLQTGAGIREGSGPFTMSDYWKLDPLGTGQDPLDFAGDFSAAVVFQPATLGAPDPNRPLVCDGNWTIDGWFVFITSIGLAQFITCNGGLTRQVVAGNVVLNAANVLCFGRAGGTIYAKLNANTTVSGAAYQVPGLSQPAYVGQHASIGRNPDPIYEAWASTQPASDALFTAIAGEVKAKLGITAW